MSTAANIRAFVADAQDRLAVERDREARTRIARELAAEVGMLAEELEGAGVAAVRETLRTIRAALEIR